MGLSSAARRRLAAVREGLGLVMSQVVSEELAVGLWPGLPAAQCAGWAVPCRIRRCSVGVVGD
jgi:hypothetical protein